MIGKDQLANLNELAYSLKLPLDWLKAQADTGRIPCLRIGRKRLFNISAVRQTLAQLAAEGSKRGKLPRVADHWQEVTEE